MKGMVLFDGVRGVLALEVLDKGKGVLVVEALLYCHRLQLAVLRELLLQLRLQLARRDLPQMGSTSTSRLVTKILLGLGLSSGSGERWGEEE